eukprot:3678138-Rhodomonas_salina.1
MVMLAMVLDGLCRLDAKGVWMETVCGWKRVCGSKGCVPLVLLITSSARSLSPAPRARRCAQPGCCRAVGIVARALGREGGGGRRPARDDGGAEAR